MAYCQLIFLAILSPVNDHHLSGGKVATVPFALPHGQLVVSVGDYCAHWPGLGAIGLAAVSLVCVHSFASPSSIRPCSGRHTVSLAICLDLAASVGPHVLLVDVPGARPLFVAHKRQLSVWLHFGSTRVDCRHNGGVE